MVREVRTEEVAAVRSFNRTVTQRVGALQDRYLSRDRSLGEARVLWEIGEGGRDVRDLRAALELDSGYLSRLLRALETAGLVALEASVGDRRVRTATLTAAGRAERRILDRRSDELARSMVEPLGADARRRLVAAMAEVERLLTAALVELVDLDASHEHARRCIGAYFAELDGRFDTGFDPNVARAHGSGPVLVARLRGEPVGCGVLVPRSRRVAEVKRMWVAPSARGLGVGRRLLTGLEERAAAAGCRAVRLDTNRTLREAIALYRSAGYEEVEPFNDEPYAHHWFEKRLRPAARRR